MHFTDKLQISFDKESSKVKFSVRVTEEMINVHIIELEVFRKAVELFNAQMKDLNK